MPKILVEKKGFDEFPQLGASNFQLSEISKRPYHFQGDVDDDDDDDNDDDDDDDCFRLSIHFENDWSQRVPSSHWAKLGFLVVIKIFLVVKYF